MTLTKLLSTTVATVALVGVVAATTTPAEAVCKKARSARATGNIEFFVKATARSRWRSTVREIDGPRFASWVRATDKVERCDKSGPGGKWRCLAKARPCD